APVPLLPAVTHLISSPVLRLELRSVRWNILDRSEGAGRAGVQLMIAERRVDDSGAIGIRGLVTGLNPHDLAGIVCKDAVPPAVEVVEASGDVDFDLAADIDLILPKDPVDAIGLVRIAHNAEVCNRGV